MTILLDFNSVARIAIVVVAVAVFGYMAFRSYQSGTWSIS
jgi:hypothetical protein